MMKRFCFYQKWIMVAVFMIFASQASATVNVVQSGFAQQSSSATSYTATITGLTAGDSIVLYVIYQNNAAVNSVSGSHNGSFTHRCTDANDTPDWRKIAIYTKDNVAAGSETITITYNFVVGNGSVAWQEIGSTSGFQACANGNWQNAPGTGTDAVKSGSVTPSAQPALVTAYSWDTGANPPNAGTGYTSVATQSPLTGGGSFRTEAKRITSTSALTATYTAVAGSGGSSFNYLTTAAIFTESNPQASISWPRLGSFPIGGSPRAYDDDNAIAWLKKQDVVVLGIWDGWQSSATKTWGATVQGIVTGSPLPIPTKVYAYYEPGSGPQNANGVDSEMYYSHTANNWYLRNPYPSGAIVNNQWSSSLYEVNLYYPGGNTDAQGRTMWKWRAQYVLDYLYSGGAYGISNGGNSSASYLTGIFSDNVNYMADACGGGCAFTGDFNRDGTSESTNNTTYWTGWRLGIRRILDEVSLAQPTLKVGGNLGSYFGSPASAPYTTEFSGYFDVGVYESALGFSNSVETWSGWTELKNGYVRAASLLKNGGIGIFGHQLRNMYPSDGTDLQDTAVPYRAAWYGMATAWVLGDAAYYANSANPGGVSTYDINQRTWFDYYAVDSSGNPIDVSTATASQLKWLGPATGTYSIVANTGTYGIHVRFFQNGMCAVNPKGNGTQTLPVSTLGGSGHYARVHGVQRPTWDDGSTVTNDIPMAVRDGICLRKL